MNVLLVGCGKMGGILLKSWPFPVHVVQPGRAGFFDDVEELPAGFAPEAVLFAVKPNVLKEVAARYRRFAPHALFISVAAGITVEFLENALGSKQIVRVMPNVALEVAASANLVYASPSLAERHKELVSNLFLQTGPLFWLDNERLLDILTPMVGSSPALFFLLTKFLIESAVDAGVDEAIASTTVRQALLGSALLAHEGGDLQELIQRVASKGGVTEAALKIITQPLENLIEEAMRASLNKIEEHQKG